MDRRAVISGVASALIAGPGLAAGLARAAWAAKLAPGGPASLLAQLEARAGGTLGAWVLDTGSGREFGWRGNERFGQCSTFKLSLAACVLMQIDAGELQGGEVIAYDKADLLPNSPLTGAKVDPRSGQGRMTLLALAQAAQQTSDNLAANLLLRRIGGPARLTAFWRAMGDRTSRLDRYETELNFVPAGEPRDTITPRGIAHSVARIMAGDRLRPASRELLKGWMIETKTGLARIRAGLPATWIAGDKTGTGGRPGMDSLINDIAITWPPGAAPVVIAGFYRAPGLFANTRPVDEGVLRQVGEIAARWRSAPKF